MTSCCLSDDRLVQLIHTRLQTTGIYKILRRLPASMSKVRLALLRPKFSSVCSRSKTFFVQKPLEFDFGTYEFAHNTIFHNWLAA